MITGPMVSGVNNYYTNPEVRARILEFLGGDSPANVTAVYLTGGDRSGAHHRSPRLTTELPALLENGLDIGRSLWDRESLIADLDVEYVNFDRPDEAYLSPERVFDLQLPVEQSIVAILKDYDILPLHLLSGRGHHFVWQVHRLSRAFKQLAKLGRVTPSLQQLYSQPHRPNGEPVAAEMGAAFAGLGLLMEYLAHRIKEEAAPRCDIPVELTAVEVGPTQRGREMISLDLSEYGDPLSTRTFRIPFSIYLKPWQQRDLLSKNLAEKLPPFFLVPLSGMESRQGIQLMRDPDCVIDLAGRASTRIPDQSDSMPHLIAAYRESVLAGFHDWFYSEEHRTPEEWPETYDRTPLEPMPHCARHILEHPNDLLLRPGGIERIVRVMLSLGWHPRHIAGLIRSKFERNHAWGEQWTGYDPATRADFYTRIFTGLFVTGHDDLVDFNCQSAKEEKGCFLSDCPDNLERFKKSLLQRRQYERLACRPFNRLFLPEEHL